MANNSYKSENSTLQFSFCLYESENSEKSCTSGLFSSLPLQSKHALWSKVFKAETGHENVTLNTEVTQSDDGSLKTIAIIGCLFLFFLLVAIAAFLQYRRLIKRWTRRNEISMELFEIEGHGRKKKKLQTGKEKESIGLLQFETECNTSCYSGESSSVGYASASFDDIHSNTDRESLIQDTDFNYPLSCFVDESLVSVKKPDTNHGAEDVGQKCRIKSYLNDNDFHKRNDSKFEYNIEKTNVTVVQSPEKRSGKEDIPADAVVPTDTQVSNGTNLESKQLDWTKIFCFLMKQLQPSQYRFFFHSLLDSAGCSNTEWHIATIEANNRGKIQNTIFELFQRWKMAVGPTANPKSIEDVFETLEMNLQLSDFRNYMRNPPFLPEETYWNEQAFQCMSTATMIAETQQHTLPQIQEAGFIQRRARTKHISSITDADPVSGNIQYEIDVIAGKKLNYHRNALPRKGGDIHEIRPKYRKVQTCSEDEEKVKTQSGRRRCRRTFRSQLRKKAVINKFVSTSRKEVEVLSLLPTSSTMFPTSSTSTSFSSSSSTSSGCYSSGYGSISSNNVEHETGHVTPNNLGNEQIAEHTFLESGYDTAQNNMFKNSGVCRNSKRRQGRQLRTPYQRKQKMVNSTEPVPQCQSDTLFQSTSSSWNVTQTNPVFLSSGVLQESQKQNRNINNEQRYERRKNKLSNYSQKTYRRKRINRKQSCKKRKQSRDDALKSAYIAGLNELFFADFLNRMTPSRKDILSIKFRSYSDAERYITKLNEHVYVLFSERHCLALRETEWNTLQLYVNKVRTLALNFNQNSEFLFLNHNGEPLV